MQCDQCKFENPEGMRFCGQCAAPLDRICSSCGSTNPDNFEFCGQCARKLADNNQTIPNNSTGTPSQEKAERRQLTVLFCDIVNSSALSSSIDPEDLREIMQDYRATCSEVVARYDGHVAQYLGDGVLVYFGHPHAHEDDARRAAHAALEIIERIQQFRFPIENSADIQLAVRTGIHTGLVVIGETGGGDKRALALGDTPNIAARIQDFAKANTLVISETTHRLLGDEFESTSLEQQSLKGFSQDIGLFRIRQARTQQNRLKAARTLSHAPLVGRDQETSLILERLEQARKGVGQVVLLNGEPGLGKTRMVQLVCDKIPEEQCALLECAGTPYYQNSFLFPIIEMVSRILELDKNTSNEDSLSRIESTVATLGINPDLAVPALAELLSIPLNNIPSNKQYPSGEESTPQQKKQLIMDILVEILQTMAQQRLVLLVVEDLQWVDPSTLELLKQLVNQPGLTNIFALFTFRNEFPPPWKTQANLTLITLNRLTRQQSGKLVRQLCHRKTLPIDVFSEIINKTDGIPLFVEELTNTVLRSELLVEKETHYELNTNMTRLGIPSTLQDSLMSRLDSMGDDKELAQLSSILGREFDYELLSALSTRDENSLHMGLNRLINAELFFQRGQPPKSQYSFRHALLRETAYQSLLKRTRQKFHQRTALLLKERFPSIIAENPELMAHHCTEAGNFDESLSYWLSAGRNAIQRSANLEAVTHLTAGLSTLGKLPDTTQRRSHELAFQCMLGIAVTACKGYAAEEVKHAYVRARELCNDIADVDAVFPSLCGLWEFHVVRAELDTALDLATEIQNKAANSQIPDLTLEAERIMGTTLFWRGQLTEALQHFDRQEQLSLSRETTTNTLVSHCQDSRVAALANASSALWLLGEPDQALERAQQALTLAKQLSHPFSQAYALQFLCAVFQLRGDHQSTEKYADAQIVLSKTYGFPFWSAMGKMMKAWATTDEHSAKTTSIQFQEALNEYEASGNRLARSYFFSMLANLQLDAEKLDAANKTIDLAIRETDSSGEKYFIAELLRIKGVLVSKGSDKLSYSIAEKYFNRALELAQQQGAKSLVSRVSSNLSQLQKPLQSE